MDRKIIFTWVLAFVFAYFTVGLFLVFYEDSAPNTPEEEPNSLHTVGSVYFAQALVPPDTGPEINNVKAIHLAYGTYLNSSYETILEEVEKSDINAIVFEIKNPLGWVALNSETHMEALRKVLPELEDRGVHAVARLVLFQDPELISSNPELAIVNSATGGAWSDYKGIVWSDPTNKNVWRYNIDIANKAYAIGFDEVNFDYVRFPTDGPLKLAQYDALDEFGTRTNTIVEFLKFAQAEIPRGMVLSVDLFGMTFINDQLVIGQSIADIAPYVDVIYPMPYPSHYPDGFIGLSNPAEYPYEVLDYTLRLGKNKLKDSDVVIRPWLQDFNLGAVYDVSKIHAQIRALKDHNIETWALWNASNRYTWSAVK
ncbi:MAG: putative glycoside hydrolase [Candidatus Spechtbacterales bacterium]|nr:putative glycoside hydrolase [Candidatus Spechtbacterales bacterium]